MFKNLLVLLFGFCLIFGNTYADKANFNYGNDTYEKWDNILVVNSLGDETDESKFIYQGVNLGYNDYIPENAFKNNLYNEGYTQVYDFDNPNLELTEVGYMGTLGNPRSYDRDYVLTSEYEKYSSQGQDVRIEKNKGYIIDNSNRITTNEINIQNNSNEIVRVEDESKDRDKTLDKRIDKNDKKDVKQDRKIDKNTKRSKENRQLIRNERQQRKEVDNKLNDKINIEKDQRKEADKKLSDRIITNKDNIKVNKRNIKKNKQKIISVDKKHTSWNETQDIVLNNHEGRINNLDNRIDRLEETQYIVGLEGRIYDTKKWQINIFADYSTYRNKVERTGIRFTYKFGRSFEEKKIEALENKIKKLLEVKQ
jgi:hypothetical protein